MGWQGFKAVESDLNAWLFMLVYASCASELVSILSSKRLVSANPWTFWSLIVNVGVATISYFLPNVSSMEFRSDLFLEFTLFLL